MAKYSVTFTTYEEYEVEADSETEALKIAEDELRTDRCIPVADTHYDESYVEKTEE